MKPPMNETIKIKIPITDENGDPIIDDYGNPETTSIQSKARVQFRSQLVDDKDGQYRQVKLEIDVPPNVEVENGTKVEYFTILDKKGEGIVHNQEEITNLAGNKVYYRTLFIRG